MTERDELIALGLSLEMMIASDGYPSARVLSNEAAADRLLESDWYRLRLADAFDQGVSAAGRYGHEDGWEQDNAPYMANPYRTPEELEADGWILADDE